MQRHLRSYRFVVAISMLIWSCRLALAAEPVPVELESPLHFVVSFVPEAHSFAEQKWPAPFENFDTQKAIKQSEVAWKTNRDAIGKLVTPNVAIALSGWVREEMKTYKRFEVPEKLKCDIVGYDAASHRVLLETTLDTLPSHSPLVTRWFKLFIVLEPESGENVEVIVTIHGELLE